MAQNTQFDYNAFLQYYTDPANYNIDPIPKNTIYYKRDRKTYKYNAYTGTIQNFIYINNVKVYIGIYPYPNNPTSPNNHILFTIPEDINGVLYDFHYHFYPTISESKRSSRKNRKSLINIIMFHKSSQDPSKNNKTNDNCYFVENENVENVQDIKCTNTSARNMADVFPILGQDFPFIKEIIRRPFFNDKHEFVPVPLPVVLGGRLIKTRKYRMRRKTTRKNRRSRAAKNINTPR